MTLRRGLLLVAVLLVLGALLQRVTLESAIPSTTSTTSTSAATSPAPPAAKPPARTRLPRVVRNVAPTAVPGAGTEPVGAGTPSTDAPAAGTDATPATGKGLVDRRENPPKDAAEQMERLKARRDEVDAAVDACLADWKAVDPNLSGRVGIAFQIDGSGLTDAWILEHSDVPFGPLTCFSTAVYGVDWSGVTDSPAEVSLEFTLDDGGE